MSKIITRLYDHFYDGEHAVIELRRVGVADRDISLVSSKSNSRFDGVTVRPPQDQTAGDAAAVAGSEGAAAGVVVGAVGGILAGLGLLAIPGLGPVVAAGWLASAAVGALAGGVVAGAAGGLVGALTHAGVSQEEADVYAEGVRRGATLVSARVDDTQLIRAEAALNAVAHVDIAARGAVYRAGGWAGFDVHAPPLPPGDTAAEPDGRPPR